MKSDLEELLVFQFNALGIGGWVRGYKFHPVRKWKIDFFFPLNNLGVEIEGGGWTGGRHTSGVGFEKDLEKYGEAMRMGINIYRCSGRMVKSGVAVKTIEDLLKIQ